MQFQGLEFLEFLLIALAVPFLALGMGLASIGVSNSHDFDSFREECHRLLNPIFVSHWFQLPGHAARIVVNTFNVYIDYWFRQSENNLIVGGLFGIIILIGIPVWSIISLFQGGSSFLFTLIFFILVSLLILAFASEINRMSLFKKFLSVLIFILIFLLVPGYVSYSFTNRILNLAVGHAAIGCLLIAPILYLLCQAAALAITQLIDVDGKSTVKKFVGLQFIYFFGTFPLAYVLIFASFLAGQFSASEQPLPITWSMVLSSTINISFSFALTIQVLGWLSGARKPINWCVGISVIFLLSVIFGFSLIKFGMPADDYFQRGLYNIMLGKTPTGLEYQLGPLFWIMHQTFLPFLVLILVTLFLFISRFLRLVSFIKLSDQNYNARELCRLGGSALGILGFLIISLAINI